MMHIGIIGGGNISGTHARAAREIDGLEVAAVYGFNQEKSRLLGQEFGAAVYTDLNAFLDHRPMDLVAIGSPSSLHAEQGIAAARQGLHVLVEKPIDVNLKSADALIAECDTAGVKLGLFFQDRTAPDLWRLKHLIDSGVLGRPVLVSAQVKWYRTPEYYSGSRWRGIFALDGGGALMNQGVHTVDLVVWLMGDVARVQAKAITGLHQIEVEDTVVATLEFKSGAVGTLEAATSAYPGYPRRLELTGSEGTIIVEGNQIIRADLHGRLDDLPLSKPDDSQIRASSPVVADVTGHRKILEDFISAIQTNGRPLCDGREGRRSLALVEAIYESSRSGQAVILSRGRSV